LTDFRKLFEYQNLRKSFQWEPTDRQTDMTNLMVFAILRTRTAAVECSVFLLKNNNHKHNFWPNHSC